MGLGLLFPRGKLSPSSGLGASASHVCGAQICIKAKGYTACGFLGGAQTEYHKYAPSVCTYIHICTTRIPLCPWRGSMVGTLRDWTVLFRVCECNAWSRFSPTRPGLNFNQANFSHLV